jgi:hypothetical protein
MQLKETILRRNRMKTLGMEKKTKRFEILLSFDQNLRDFVIQQNWISLYDRSKEKSSN